MSLEKVLEEIKQIKLFAEEDVSSGPIETLNGRRGRKFQAIEQLKRLKREYRLSLLDTAVFIVLTGILKDEFKQIASELSGCFSADPEEFYNDLVDRIPPTAFLGKNGVNNVFDILGRHLEDKMLELDVLEYNQVFFKQEFDRKINSRQDFIEITKSAINSQIGAEIVGIQAVTSLVDKAIEVNHSGRVTPIILATSDDLLIKSLMKDLEKLTHRVFLVSAGPKQSKTVKLFDGAMIVKEATKESVDEILQSIKKSIKR